MFRARALLFPAVALVAFSACTCDTRKTVESFGVLQIEPRAIDFGTGCLDETMERTVVLTNIGNTELEILDVKTPTDGAFTIFDDIPQFLDAGESFVLHLGLTPEDASDYAGTISITTDAQEDATQSMTLVGKGFAGEKYDFQVTCETVPDSGDFNRESCLLVSFEDVLAGTSLDRRIQLENRGCGIVNVNEFYFYADPLGDPDDVALFSSPDTTAPFELRGLSKHVSTLTFSPEAAGEPFVRLRMATTDPEVKIQGRGWEPGEWDLGLFASAVEPALLVDPTTLTFFEAVAGAPLEKKLLVANTGGSPLTIDSIVINGENGTQDFTLASGDAGPFTLGASGSGTSEREVGVIYTSSGPGSDKATLVVTAGQETRQVSLLGGTQPLLVVRWVDPDTQDEVDGRVDFGITAIGQKDIERMVRLYNEGQAPLNVTGIEIVENPGGGYALVSGTPGTIAPGGSVELGITFDDNVGLRNDTAKLQVSSNDPVDALSGGVRLVDLVSTNEPNFKPVPSLEFCPKEREDSTQCSSNARVGSVLELDASASTGPEAGDTLTFEWTLRPPTGSTARIEAVNDIRTRIVSDDGPVLDVAGNYNVTLVVKDQYENATELRQVITTR